MRPFLTLQSVLLLVPASLASQPLTTDRPDVTESPNAVAAGRIQVELGATLETYSTESQGTDQTVLTLPEALVRIGVVPGIEARVTAPDYSRVEFGGGASVVDGFENPTLGLKAEVGTVGGAAVGFIAQTTIPVSNHLFDNDFFVADRFVPSAILTVGADLTETLSLGGQVQGEYFGEERGPFGGSGTIGATAVLGFTLSD